MVLFYLVCYAYKFLLYSIDVQTVDIGDCDVSFKGGITNPRVQVSLSNIYIKITGRYRKKILYVQLFEFGTLY